MISLQKLGPRAYAPLPPPPPDEEPAQKAPGVLRGLVMKRSAAEVRTALTLISVSHVVSDFEVLPAPHFF